MRFYRIRRFPRLWLLAVGLVVICTVLIALAGQIGVTQSQTQYACLSFDLHDSQYLLDTQSGNYFARRLIPTPVPAAGIAQLLSPSPDSEYQVWQRIQPNSTVAQIYLENVATHVRFPLHDTYDMRFNPASAWWSRDSHKLAYR